jgi:hypothetical protein
MRNALLRRKSGAARHKTGGCKIENAVPQYDIAIVSR